MIVANAAGRGGRAETGGETEVMENQPTLDVLPTTTTNQSSVVVTITNAAKTSLHAYFTSVKWPLNKALPKKAACLDSTLGNIMSEFHLVWLQIAQQLLNYKK